MSERAHRLLREALELSASERAQLAAELVSSLDGMSDDHVELAWATEIEQRARQALASPDGGIDWEIIRSDLRTELQSG